MARIPDVLVIISILITSLAVLTLTWNTFYYMKKKKTKASFRRPKLEEGNFSGVDLSGANLTDCKDVTLEQLLQAEALYGAILPAHINPADLGNKWSPPNDRDNMVEVDSRTTNLGDQPIDKLLKPPAFATYLLYFVPRKHRGDIISDLAEEFQDIHDEHGHRKAVIWYWGQVITSFWPLLKWLLVGWIVDAFRRFIS